jgi:hypothetical protein
LSALIRLYKGVECESEGNSHQHLGTSISDYTAGVMRQLGY